MRYYKVVSIAYGTDRMTSFSVSNDSPYCVRYQLGQRAVPPVGGLLAFRTLGDAQRFGSKYGMVSILRGRGRRRRLSRWRSPWSVRDTMRAAWAGRLESGLKRPWPAGTVALEWFEPEEVVE